MGDFLFLGTLDVQYSSFFMLWRKDTSKTNTTKAVSVGWTASASSKRGTWGQNATNFMRKWNKAQEVFAAWLDPANEELGTTKYSLTSRAFLMRRSTNPTTPTRFLMKTQHYASLFRWGPDFLLNNIQVVLDIWMNLWVFLLSFKKNCIYV